MVELYWNVLVTLETRALIEEARERHTVSRERPAVVYHCLIPVIHITSGIRDSTGIKNVNQGLCVSSQAQSFTSNNHATSRRARRG